MDAISNSIARPQPVESPVHVFGVPFPSHPQWTGLNIQKNY